MGNRAVIAFSRDQSTVGIYLHWNGGPESVLAFLQAAKQYKLRNPQEDSYGVARLAQVIGNFFGGTTFVGVDRVQRLDTGAENGIYFVDGQWNIEESVKGLPITLEDERLDWTYYSAVLQDVLKANDPFFLNPPAR